MRFWRGLSPATRLLALAVLLASLGTTAWVHWLRPHWNAVATAQREVEGLRRDVHRMRRAPAQSHEEDASERSWQSFAPALAAQSSGRSVEELLESAAAASSDLALRRVRFDRKSPARGLRRLHFVAEVSGSYPQVVALLQRLDTTFPPIELTRVRTAQPQANPDAPPYPRGWVDGIIEGVLYEPPADLSLADLGEGAGLRGGASTIAASAGSVPSRNPFVRSGRWARRSQRAHTAHAQAPLRRHSGPHPLTLRGVVQRGGHWVALFAGGTAAVGETVAGWRVESIDAGGVTLSRNGQQMRRSL